MKTKEQLADEYANAWTSEQLCDLKDAIGLLVNYWEQRAFLAGYGAAMEQLDSQAKTIKETND